MGDFTTRPFTDTVTAQTCPAFVAIVLLLVMTCTAPAVAQSGRGAMDGYVVLRGSPPEAHQRAHVELLGTNPRERVAYKVDTDERGLFHIPGVWAGEYRLRISATGFTSYETTLYVPSDFLGNLAVILKSTAKGKSDQG